jgi:hypothetical protein
MPGNGASLKRKYVELDNTSRSALLQDLLRVSDNGIVTPATMRTYAGIYGVSAKTVKRVYDKSQAKTGGVIQSVNTARKGKCGGKFKHPDLASRIRSVPYSERTSLQSLAHAVGVPCTTLWRRYNKGYFKKYSRPLKPALSAANKYVRSHFALKFVNAENLVSDMDNYVHIDEKWFYLKRCRQKVYGMPDENIPLKVSIWTLNLKPTLKPNSTLILKPTEKSRTKSNSI